MNPRIMSWLSLILLALLMAVRAARAASNMDSAANYPGGWESGSNGGGGFEAWALDSYAGDGWAGGGIWDSLEADLNMGTCFGFGARGTDAVFTASRDFSTPMTNGDLLKLDLGLNYDTGGTGNKGFLLYTTDAGEIILVNMADSGTITVNGNDALVDYGTGTMHWTITQISATQVLVYATGRTGSEAYVDVFDLGQESHLAGIKFYASGGTNDEYYAYRQVYFDNLILSQDSVGTAGYTYSIESNRAVIQSVDTSISGHILIPATLGGYPVGAIGRSAFINCTGITGIVFPENTMVDTIGPNAFQGCTGLLYATLPDALVELSPGLFYGCKNLLAVTIPDSVLHIGAGAFAQCENLQTIDLPAGLSILDESALLNARRLTQIVFPADCTIAEEQVCYEGRSLALAAFPDGLSEIQKGAFYNCFNLERIDMDAADVILGDEAFAGCSALTKAVFHTGLAAIGENVFVACENLEGIYTAGSVPDTDANSFNGLTGTTLYYLPGASGWTDTLAGLSAAEWLPLLHNLRQLDDSFAFDVEWANGQPLTAQYRGELDDGITGWSNICSSTTSGTGACTMSDADWRARPISFYRVIRPE